MRKTFLFLSFIWIFLPIASYSQCPTNDLVELETQSEINSFGFNYPDCTELPGGLQIGRWVSPTLNNYTVNDLSPLSNLTRIKGKLRIGFNTNLTDLSGLDNLRVIEGSAEIRGGFNTPSLHGLHNLDTVGASLILQSVDIESTNDFSALKFVGGNIYLFVNDDLTEVNFPNLQDIGGYLNLNNNENLQAIKGMEQLSSISGGLIFNQCHELTDLSGLSNLQSIGKSLIFANTYNDSILMNLTALDTIHGDLRIVDNYISALHGLEWIKHIGGQIAYENNKNITGLLNFENTLPEVGSILLFENDNLESIDGLNVVSTTEGVEIKNHSGFAELHGLSKLTTIGGSLTLENNRLENIDSLHLLESIGGNLIIENQFLLENLDGLENLISINGELILDYNDNLNDISGLKNINPLGISNLQITQNINLAICDYANICNYISGINAFVNIENNAEGCNAPQQIPCVGHRVNGKIYYDKESNATFDNADIGIRNAILRMEPSGFEYYTNASGEFSPLVKDGSTFTILPVMEEFWIPTTDSISYTITQDPDTLANNTYDFGFSLLPDVYKGTISLASEPTRCNDFVSFYLQATNEANTLSSGYLTLQIDPNSSLFSSVPPDDFFDEQTNELVWYFEDMEPSEIYSVELLVKMPSEVFIGSPLCFSAKMVDTSNGGETVLDSFIYKPTLLCAFDPNDKLVSPEGVQEDHLTLFEDSIFTYTIRFQNTGNAPARHIRILDTLDNNLNLNSFRVTHSSFSAQVRAMDRALEFYFEDINLPDSISNEPESHGFVTYEIKTKPGLPENTRIENTAHIIFDLNPAIVTNTTFNTLVSEIFVDADEDGFYSDVDCDDGNVAINPDATEIPNNDIDEDCDGIAQEIDADEDGFNSDEDCNDDNADINPDATEIPNNDIDEDCDGLALEIDADEDGFNSDEDCNDDNADINPDATEIPNNDIDEDCDGVALEIDADEDGFNSDEDCDDDNAAINPDAIEIPNNGIDEDCDGADLINSNSELGDIDINIYPNPVQNNLLIELVNIEEPLRLSLFSINGKLILEQDLIVGQQIIEMSALPAGLYQVEIVGRGTQRKMVRRVEKVR